MNFASKWNKMGQVIQNISDLPVRIEKNADERVHIHSDPLRLDLSLEEYEIFRKFCLEACKKLKERHNFNEN